MPREVFMLHRVYINIYTCICISVHIHECRGSHHMTIRYDFETLEHVPRSLFSLRKINLSTLVSHSVASSVARLGVFPLDLGDFWSFSCLI